MNTKTNLETKLYPKLLNQLRELTYGENEPKSVDDMSLDELKFNFVTLHQHIRETIAVFSTDPNKITSPPNKISDPIKILKPIKIPLLICPNCKTRQTGHVALEANFCQECGLQLKERCQIDECDTSKYRSEEIEIGDKTKGLISVPLCKEHFDELY